MYEPSQWEFKKCLRLSLAVLLVPLGLVGSASIRSNIPILRKLDGFIFLTYIPGTFILQIRNIKYSAKPDLLGGR